MYVKKLASFRRFKVHLNLQTKSVEVNSVYFLLVISLEAYLSLLSPYSSVNNRFIPRFIIKKDMFEPRGLDRKILSVAVTNQIAGNAIGFRLLTIEKGLFIKRIIYIQRCKGLDRTFYFPHLSNNTSPYIKILAVTWL